MKSKRLWTVERRQVGDERTNLLELLQSRDLVANVELELVLKDGIREPDLQHNSRNSATKPSRCSTCQKPVSPVARHVGV